MANTSGPTRGAVQLRAATAVDNSWAGDRYLKSGNDRPAKETVFDETTFVPKKTDNSAAVKATRDKARRMSLRFFIVAVISLAETIVFMQRDLLAAAFATGIVAALFAVLGFFAFAMKKGAFLTGAVLYGLNTLFLGLAFLLSGNLVLVYAVVVHCIIVWRLYCMYDLIRYLESD